MNLTEASEVARLLHAVYVDGDPQSSAAIHTAKWLAERTSRPLSASGRKYVRPEQIIRPREHLFAEGSGPLLDPDCRDGKHGSCVGAPCECTCHGGPQ